MKPIETQAKTIEEAIEHGLAQLNLSHDQVEIEVISGGGMFKKAKVKLTPKVDVAVTVKQESKTEPKVEVVKQETSPEKKPVEKKMPAPKPQVVQEDATPITSGVSQKLDTCVVFVQKLMELLGHDVALKTTVTERAYTIEINGEDVGRLIGKGGDALNALQVVVSSIAISNSNGDPKRVYVNVENYKERRVETLKQLAQKKATFAKESGRNVKLEPMSPRDRAIIHTEIQNINGVRSYSIGDGNSRRLVITAEKT